MALRCLFIQMALIAGLVEAEEPRLAKEFQPLEWMVGEWQVDNAELVGSRLCFIRSLSPITIRAANQGITMAYSYTYVWQSNPPFGSIHNIEVRATILLDRSQRADFLLAVWETGKHAYGYASQTGNTPFAMVAENHWQSREPDEHLTIKRIDEDKLEFTSISRAMLRVKCHRVAAGAARQAEFKR